MGICPARAAPVSQDGLLREIQHNQSILRLQEIEISQQTAKSSVLLQQLSVLILDKDQAGLASLRPLLEQGEEEISALEETVLACKGECESLSSQLNTLQINLEHASSLPLQTNLDTINSSLTAVHNQLTHTHKKLKEVEEDITSAKQLRQVQDALRLQAVQQRTIRFEDILRKPVHWLNDPVRKAFIFWKLAVKHRSEEPIRMWEPIRNIASDASKNYVLLTDMDEEEETEFQVALDEEAWWLVEGNPLNHPALSKALETAQPLGETQLSTVLSSVFAAKLAHDQDRRLQGIEPLLFPHFLLAHFSAEPQANDRLAEVIRSVAQSRSTGSKQGKLWSALLHLDVKATALTQISQNLSLIVPAFLNCAARCPLSKSGLLLEEKAYLSDVFNLLIDKLASDSRSGEEIMNLLRPEEVNQLDFTFFRLMHCMKVQNVDSLGVFRHIDRAGKGVVDIQQLTKGLKECLIAWIPENDIMTLLEQVDNSGKGLISRQKFTEFTYNRYYKLAQSPLFTVKLGSFLLCLVTVALSKAALIIQQLKEILNWTDLQELRQSEFFQMAKTAFAEYTSSELEKIWGVALNLSGAVGGIKAAFVLRALLRYPPALFCDSVLCKTHADSRSQADMKLSA